MSVSEQERNHFNSSGATIFFEETHSMFGDVPQVHDFGSVKWVTTNETSLDTLNIGFKRLYDYFSGSNDNGAYECLRVCIHPLIYMILYFNIQQNRYEHEQG